MQNENLYYNKKDELLPVPARFVRETAQGNKIIESDFFFGQVSIHGESFANHVSTDYKSALGKTVENIAAQIAALETRKQFFLELLDKDMPDEATQSEIISKFGEPRNVQKTKSKELRNLDLTLSLVGFLNHLEENGKLCVERSE